MKKYRKHKKTKIITNPWDFNAEVGDLYYQSSSTGNILSRIYESTGYYKSRAGDLSYRTIRPPDGYAMIAFINGKLYWITADEWNQIVVQLGLKDDKEF